jgi:hypothetical protein
MASVYEMALSNAKGELHTIRKQFDELAQRKEKLENFIAITEALMGPSAQAQLPLPVPDRAPMAQESDRTPLWKMIKFAINGDGNAFSVSDAIAALERIGKPVTSPNKMQIVRNAIMKRGDVFRKLSAGTYCVIDQKSEVLKDHPM